jgi:hypothetical protein
MTSNPVVAVLRADTRLMVDFMKGTSMACGFTRVSPRRSSQVRYPLGSSEEAANQIDQLTIMVESSRLFLFTEYARKGCGVIDEHGTDYKVWEALPVSLAKE